MEDRYSMRAIKGLVMAAPLAALLFVGPTARAGLTLSVQGTVTSSNNAGNFLPAGIVNGTAFAAVISFDDSAADTNASPTSGSYALPNLSATITIGGTTITISPSSPRYSNFPAPGPSATINNDYPGFTTEDRYQIDYLSADAPNGYTDFERFLLQLTDFRLAGSAGDSPLSSDALAGVVPDPSKFNGNRLFSYRRSEDGVASSFQGTISSIEQVVVPEPSTLISGSLAGMAGLGFAWRRRKARAIA